MYTGKSNFKSDRQKRDEKIKEEGKKLYDEKNKRLKEIHTVFSENLTQYASQYQDKIKKNPHFRQQFNELCQGLGIDPMVTKKSLLSDLGYGSFYLELSTKILDICAKRRKENGGMMKIEDIIKEFHIRHKEQINKYDVLKAIETVKELGGVSIVNQEYVCTVPVEFSSDVSDLTEMAEQNGFVSFELMQKNKQWNKDRFEQKINSLQKEGLVWADKKTGNNQICIRFFNIKLINFKLQSLPGR
ncbi:hypothetical protein PPERSA_02494 [Pseudocohnilembus persalinus]|uniref:Vacuolar-sorting protein SNF8 n=1 Tax=Pseudocohnilembus persalinus TaxID=266149 RepID=A0A0V0QAX4_PSEPJ|nr:hypothetical protein PPERSA_02494 [Pseudocohnilembus persalinus]|eukprot:KRW99382.1 hypothetical protein PPERSA_02494 [Pseudocohnilembus persalinus]